MSKYIDLIGLSRFLAKCREVFYSKPSGGIPKNDLAKDVRSVIDELKAPLIVEGSFSQATQGASFAPSSGQPSRDDAIAAFLEGRRVVLKGQYVSTTNFVVSVVSVDEDSSALFGYIYSGSFGSPDVCVWD